VCRPPDFFTAKRRSAVRPDFTRAKSESVPGGGSGRRVGVPARAAKTARRKNPGFFPAPTRMYKEARPPFSQKKPLTFRPGRVMDVRTRRETAHKAQPGRAGEAAAGRKEHTP